MAGGDLAFVQRVAQETVPEAEKYLKKAAQLPLRHIVERVNESVVSPEARDKEIKERDKKRILEAIEVGYAIASKLREGSTRYYEHHSEEVTDNEKIGKFAEYCKKIEKAYDDVMIQIGGLQQKLKKFE